MLSNLKSFYFHALLQFSQKYFLVKYIVVNLPSNVNVSEKCVVFQNCNAKRDLNRHVSNIQLSAIPCSMHYNLTPVHKHVHKIV